LEQDEEAEEAYDRAIEINPDSMLAWQGLLSFYEKRNKTEKLVSTIEKLMPRAIETQDGAKLADYLKKLLNVYKTENDEKNHLETLKLFLPQSKYYELIKDQPNLPDPLQVWTTIIASVEKETSHEIDAEVQARRFRVSNLTPAQVREQVESECYARSKLDTMYQNAIDIQTDPVQVKACKIKLLHLYSKKLLAVTDKKEVKEMLLCLNYRYNISYS
jgi:tetratricopeptide (TPR) repeat protein